MGYNLNNLTRCQWTINFESTVFIRRLLLQIPCYFIAFCWHRQSKSETLSCHLSFDIWSNSSWHPVLQLIRTPRPNEGLIRLFRPDRCLCTALAHLSLRLSHWARGKAPNLGSHTQGLNANELGKCFKMATSSAPVWAYCPRGEPTNSHNKKTSRSELEEKKTISSCWQLLHTGKTLC